MNKVRICILPGDGIGPEIMDQAVKVLNILKKIYGLDINLTFGLIGGAAIDKFNKPLPDETVKMCLNSDAVLLGSVGGPKWDNLPHEKKPETGGLLALRKELDLYANLRPVILFEELRDISPLSSEKKIDLITVRELSSGIYFGTPKKLTNDIGKDTMIYRKEEVIKIAETAFKIASKRRKKVTSVDKANVLYSSALWRKTVSKVSEKYPGIKLENLYIDNAAMQLILNPYQFDVILTSNLFGDIISDESAALVNSLGLLPSASLGKRVNLYEPAGGSAPDIGGKNVANPIAQILSVAMMFEHSFNLKKITSHIYCAIKSLLSKGVRTADISTNSENYVKTSEFGDLLCRELER